MKEELVKSITVDCPYEGCDGTAVISVVKVEEEYWFKLEGPGLDESQKAKILGGLSDKAKQKIEVNGVKDNTKMHQELYSKLASEFLDQASEYGYDCPAEEWGAN